MKLSRMDRNCKVVVLKTVLPDFCEESCINRGSSNDVLVGSVASRRLDTGRPCVMYVLGVEGCPWSQRGAFEETPALGDDRGGINTELYRPSLRRNVQGGSEERTGTAQMVFVSVGSAWNGTWPDTVEILKRDWVHVLRLR